MKEVIILHHVANEPAGTLLDYLQVHQIPHRSIDLFREGYVWPDPASVRALVVMGGPMNVYEETAYPFLAEENRFIQESLKRRIPYLGICLGSQLLAKALGAKVYKASQEELGWDDIQLLPSSRKDRIFSNLKSQNLKVLQWHGDTFDLPKGAVHLASSRAVPHQAFTIDELFYGFQFHVEVNRPMLQDWFKSRPDLSEILSVYDAYQPALKKITDLFYSKFFS